MPVPKRYVISATLLTCSPLAIHTGMGSLDLETFEIAPEDGESLNKKPSSKQFRHRSDWSAVELESCDQLVARDWAGRPYIPGSSLKGVIREFLTRPGLENQRHVVGWLLGRDCAAASDSGAQDEQQCEGGAGIFEDAFLDVSGFCVWRKPAVFKQWNDAWVASMLTSKSFSKQALDFATGTFSADDAFAANSWRAHHEQVALLTDTHHLPFWDPRQLTYVEHRVGVDRRTGTASNHKLFTSEVVPAGLPFRIQFIVDHGEPAQAATGLLLQALAGFNLDPVHVPLQLGSGTNHGWGRLACLFPTVRVQAWTPSERVEVSPDELDILSELKKGLDNPPAPRTTRIQLRLQLAFDGPFLVNDPAKVCALEAVAQGVVRSGSDEECKAPDHVPRVASLSVLRAEPAAPGKTSRAGLSVRALLPGTGFRGPVRSQLERILRTIHPGLAVAPHGELDPVTDDAPGFVQQLLGYADQESGIWCSEFLDLKEQDISRSKRELVAIDRFTGGASAHAKFDVLYLDRPTLEGVLAFDLPRDDDAARRVIGAGILLVRDVLEGDVAFGFGDMKSYGRCRGQVLSLAVAGLDHGTDIGKEIERQTGTGDLNQWMNDVLEMLVAGSSDSRVITANQLLDGFLAAVRRRLPPSTRLPGAT